MTRKMAVEYFESCMKAMRDNVAINQKLREEAWRIIEEQDLTIAELRAQVANFVTLTEGLRVREEAG
jgi:hypothetical protein